MPNLRRLKSWLAGIGCAFFLVWLTIILTVAYQVIAINWELIKKYIPQIVQDAPWETVAMIAGLMIIGFLLGRQIVIWAYREDY